MRVFYVFLLLCFLAGMLPVRIKPIWRALGLLGLCALVIFAYYFLHQI